MTGYGLTPGQCAFVPNAIPWKLAKPRKGTVGRTALSDGNAPPMRAFRRQEKPPTGEIPAGISRAAENFHRTVNDLKKSNPGSARDSRSFHHTEMAGEPALPPLPIFIFLHWPPEAFA